MKNTDKYIILSYGLFLVWLLSFLYNGPVLLHAFKESGIDISYLAMTYIVMPAIVSLGLSFFLIKEENCIRLMEYSVWTTLIGTVVLIFLSNFLNFIFVYILAGILGVASVLFIAGWGVLFVHMVSLNKMYITMAYLVCIGKGLFSVNEILCNMGLGSVSIVAIFASLLFSYYYVLRLKKVYAKEQFSKKLTIAFDINLIIMLCFTMFFINVGGGFSQTFFIAMTKNTCDSAFFVDVFIYISVLGLLVLVKKIKIHQLHMTISLTLLAIGYLMFITLRYSAIPSYIITLIAYLFIDILLWGMVGQMGYMFGKPLKVFFAVMGSNLLAVFIGNVLAVYFGGTQEKIYIAISICAICTILAFSFSSVLYKRFDKIFSEFKNINNINETSIDIFTEKEREIVALMLLELKNKDIAEKVGISENTLKTHARNIYSKAGVKSKKELIALNKKGELLWQTV